MINVKDLKENQYTPHGKYLIYFTHWMDLTYL